MDKCNSATEPKTESKVALAFSGLESAVTDIEALVETLATELESVLLPMLPSSESIPQVEAKDACLSCSLAGHVNEISKQVCDVRRNMEDIHDRLQL